MKSNLIKFALFSNCSHKIVFTPTTKYCCQNEPAVHSDLCKDWSFLNVKKNLGTDLFDF
jgi:hypothetical protein